MRWWVLAVVAAVLAGGCSSSPAAGKSYEIRGQVLGVRPEIREVRLAHDDIPGYMPAMSMSFGVKDVGLLNGLVPGDLIQATLVVTEADAWLSAVAKTGHGPMVETPETTGEDDPPAAAAPDLLEPGGLVPDGMFTDQDGRPFTLARTRGRAVALTFIYTRCPLPTFCPRMDRHFAQVQRLVEGRAGLRGRVQLITVSFDPGFDTPSVLRQHAASIGANLDSWRFLTGERDSIDQFATRFGISMVRDDANIVHNLRTAVIDPDGRLVKILSGGDWTPLQLVADLSAALGS